MADWESYEGFAYEQGIDPDNEVAQEAYFIFHEEYGGHVDSENEDSFWAYIDFLEAFGIEYDIDEEWERYME